MAEDPAEPLRAICLALPQVTECPSHGTPTWLVHGEKSVVTLWARGHHQNQLPHLWCAAPPGAQAELIASDQPRLRVNQCAQWFTHHTPVCATAHCAHRAAGPRAEWWRTGA